MQAEQKGIIVVVTEDKVKVFESCFMLYNRPAIFSGGYSALVPSADSSPLAGNCQRRVAKYRDRFLLIVQARQA